MIIIDSPEKLITACKNFINEKNDVAEFQKSLEIIFLPDKYKNTLETAQHNAHNTLEKIIYLYPPEEQFPFAKKVAEELIFLSRQCINKKL